MKRQSGFVVCSSLVLALGACNGGATDGAKSPADDAGKTKSKPDAGAKSRVFDAGSMINDKDGASTPLMEDEGLVSSFLADAGDGWQSLIQAHWHIPANHEAYRCARLTATKDVSLHTFRTLSPMGTHHTVLTLAHNPTNEDGLSDCSAATNEPNAIFGSGVGTNDYVLPDGIAIRVKAGQQLLVNMHLFNSSDHEIEGTSGTLVQTMPDDQVTTYAESILAGPTTLDIPPGMGITQQGDCTMATDFTLIAVLAHMHTHGVHLKATAHSSVMGDVVLHDADYTFDQQLVYPIDPVQVKKGDKVTIECTYDNPGDAALHFGESTLDEMCFAGIWRYPAQDSSFFFCNK